MYGTSKRKTNDDGIRHRFRVRVTNVAGRWSGKAKSRLGIGLALALVTPLGFAFKFYRGPWHVWFNDYGAGLLYEVFWILVFLFLWPTRHALRRIAAWVFGVTCALETLQLWHPPFLEAIRSTFLGRALIGTSFVWWDFPHYVVGTALGYALGLLLLDGHLERELERDQAG